MAARMWVQASHSCPPADGADEAAYARLKCGGGLHPFA